MLNERDPGLRQRQREVSIDHFPNHPHLYYEENEGLSNEIREFVSKWLIEHPPWETAKALADRYGQHLTLREAAEKWEIPKANLSWWERKLAKALRRMI